jgi:hypothetical protein
MCSASAKIQRGYFEWYDVLAQIKCTAAVTHILKPVCRGTRHIGLHLLLCLAPRMDGRWQQELKMDPSCRGFGAGRWWRSLRATEQRRDLLHATDPLPCIRVTPNSNRDAAPTNRAAGRPPRAVARVKQAFRCRGCRGFGSCCQLASRSSERWGKTTMDDGPRAAGWLLTAARACT